MLHVLTSHSNTNDKLVSTAVDSLSQPLIKPLHCHRTKAAFAEVKSTSVVMLLTDASSTAEDARGRARIMSCVGSAVAYSKISGEGVGNANKNGPQCSACFNKAEAADSITQRKVSCLMKLFN